MHTPKSKAPCLYRGGVAVCVFYSRVKGLKFIMESTKSPVMVKKRSLKIIPRAGGLLAVGEVLAVQAW